MINTTTNIQVLSISQKIIAGSLALFIGLSLIYGIGHFQNIMLHNGAHDLRHAAGFPCH
ncbi:MAG: CbtB-domain containing protein [Devosiaceae bacterium]|nr:CbtB-domain containing protein [Devosiaceae bacterium]